MSSFILFNAFCFDLLKVDETEKEQKIGSEFSKKGDPETAVADSDDTSSSDSDSDSDSESKKESDSDEAIRRLIH